MEEKTQKALERFTEELQKIEKKENKLLFFVIDSKGNPSGTLEYIYKMALAAKKDGYSVTMLHQEKAEEFVGVGEWLGEEYSSLQHSDINKGEVSVSPSDILFIPDIFSNVMEATKELPCKRIAIVQNTDFITEIIPLGKQWGDFGILEAIVNTKEQEKILKDYFPYLKTTVLEPKIDPIFFNTEEPKKMVINVISQDQSDINKIVKPFYWKFPTYRWVSFRDIRGVSKQDFSEALREAAITIWCDEKTKFGYTAIEALASGNILIGKLPNDLPSWMLNEDGSVKNCGLWFKSFDSIHNMIAAVVRAWTTDQVPEEIKQIAQEVAGNYSQLTFETDAVNIFKQIINKRKSDMEELLVQLKSKEKE